jgi:hypothetical protein
MTSGELVDVVLSDPNLTQEEGAAAACGFARIVDVLKPGRASLPLLPTEAEQIDRVLRSMLGALQTLKRLAPHHLREVPREREP